MEKVTIKKRIFQYEKKVIDPILKLIKKHQIFLTQKENLPQLAKLGYMYNTLWYAGRSINETGLIPKYDCEDNPKYKIEMCEPINQDIDNYIYDAWGMHITRSDEELISFEKFKSTVLDCNKEYSEVELLELQPNKTMDDWIRLKSHPDYRYSKSLFSTRKRIVDYLLCTIGTGYGLKNGYIIKKASGADQDITDYGQWENAKLDSKFIPTIEKILEYPEVKLSIDTYMEYCLDFLLKRNVMFLMSSESETLEKKLETITDIDTKLKILSSLKDVVNKKWQKWDDEKENEPVKYSPYYPLSDYSIITQLDETCHPSYIKAAIEVCRDILANKDGEIENGGGHGPNNIKEAEILLEKYSKYDI